MIIKTRYLKGLIGLGLMLSLSWLLTACQMYDSYPVATPEPTVPVTVGQPTAIPRPTLPPPPTLPPRPTLPATPAGAQPQKTAVLKDGFDRIITYYFHQLNSADVYEVGLRSIRDGLAQAGIQNPAVPIPDFGTEAAANWETFSRAYTLVADKYKGQVSEDDLAQFAFQGTLASFRDCQSGFFTPTQADDYAQQRLSLQQSLVGIGINLQSNQQNGQNVHVIVHIIAGGPAEKAGVRVGDQIAAIDGQSLTAKSQTDVAGLLRGRAVTDPADKALGTTVKLTLRRAGQDQTINLTRATVQIPFMEHGIVNNIGYLRFNRFPIIPDQTQFDTNSKLLASWLNEFSQAHITGLIIDLRDNFDGSIRLVQNFLSYFVSGSSLLYLQGSQAAQSGGRQYGVIAMSSTQGVTPIDTPLAVLVNGNTQAEAELFAYAIQRNKRGTIVGDTTAGCMVASNPSALQDNSVINLTIYRAVADQATPDALVPDVEPEQKVSLDFQQLLQGKDSQLEAAIKVLTK